MTSETNGEEQRGTSYTRWGRTVCEGNATLVYKGIECISSRSAVICHCFDTAKHFIILTETLFV